MVVVTESYHYNTTPLGYKFYLKFSPACHRPSFMGYVIRRYTVEDFRGLIYANGSEYQKEEGFCILLNRTDPAVLKTNRSRNRTDPALLKKNRSDLYRTDLTSIRPIRFCATFQ